MQKKTAYKLLLIKELREKNIIDFEIRKNIYNIFYFLYNYIISILHQKNK